MQQFAFNIQWHYALNIKGSVKGSSLLLTFLLMRRFFRADAEVGTPDNDAAGMKVFSRVLPAAIAALGCGAPGANLPPLCPCGAADGCRAWWAKTLFADGVCDE